MIALYAGGAALVVGFAVGWTVRDWKADSDDLQRGRAAAMQLEGQQRGIHAASARYQSGNAGAGERERVVVKEVERVLEKPVYRESCLDADGLRILGGDIEASNTRRGLGPTLPAASGPVR